MDFLDSNTEFADPLKRRAGGQGDLIRAALQLVNSPDIGGPSGFVQSLAKQGQGGTVTSWLSTGKNLPISSDALVKVFGQEKIHELAGNLGMSIPSLLSGLTVVLPELIDKLSPEGLLPPNDKVENSLGQLAKNFFNN